MIEALSRERVTELLFTRGAVEIGKPRRFKYHDKHPDAPIPQLYINVRGYPKGHLSPGDLSSIGHYMASAFWAKGPRPFDLVAPLPDAGIPLGEAFQEVWPNQVELLRLKKVTTEGGRQIIPETDDSYESGMKVLLLDDVCSTSATKQEGILVLRQLGLIVEEGLTLVSYQLGGEEEIKNLGVELHWSLTVPWMLDYYLDNHMVGQAVKLQVEASLAALRSHMASHRSDRP